MPTVRASLELAFRSIDRDNRALLERLHDDGLFARPAGRRGIAPFSCGEYLIRSAAMVEKAFGGITTRLWDDPFEWTLPEKLQDKIAIAAYFDEVENVRLAGFRTFSTDDDLLREIPAPERLRSLLEVMMESVSLARHFQGRAYAVFQTLFEAPLPRL